MSRRTRMFERKLKELLYNYEHKLFCISTSITHTGVRQDIQEMLDLMGIKYEMVYQGLRLIP
jgi:aminopeptidase-like protein